jgi:hypothetical protein
MRPKSKPLSFLLFCLLFLVCCASVVSAFRGYDGERYEEAAAAAAAAAAAYSSSSTTSSAVPGAVLFTNPSFSFQNPTQASCVGF